MAVKSNKTIQMQTLSKCQEQEEPKEIQGLTSTSESPKSGLAAVNFRNLKWTRRDVTLTILQILVTFGDAVEIYLPGVITQSASSEMGVSQTQEGLLGIILYLCLALSSFILPAIKNKVGRKGALLASLYTSVIATVFCSVVPNYWTLIVSRALLGLCIGSNMCISGVYYTEEISSYAMYNVGTLLTLLAFTIGGGWVGVLGYFLLNRIGWRYFIVCTSVPLFLPPIYILHCVLTNEATELDLEDSVELLPEVDAEVIKEVIEVNGFWGRLIKGCVTNFINALQGWGSILLIPALLAQLNKQLNNLTMDQQLLILALLYGGVKLIGRILSVFLLKYVRFRILQPLLSVIIASCYLTLILEDYSVVVIVAAMGIANMCYCVTASELTLMAYDKHYFGTERLVLAVGVMSGCNRMGATVGATAAMFFSSPNAVIFTFVLSCVQVVTFCCITDR